MSTLDGAVQQALSAKPDSPTLIGLYGLPGAGKSTLLIALEAKLGTDHFNFFDGSDVLACQLRGGIEEFRTLSRKRQVEVRTKAIHSIQIKCHQLGKCGIVAGHAMFWDDIDAPKGDIVTTPADMMAFTHVFYLHVPADVIARRHEADTDRRRTSLPATHLDHWQQAEQQYLKEECWKNGVVFSELTDQSVDNASRLFNFCDTGAVTNFTKARAALDAAIAPAARSILVFDADKTLAAQDAGKLFWERVGHGGKVLDHLFRSPLAYRFEAFKNATLLYEELDDKVFGDVCSEVAKKVALFPEVAALLSAAQESTESGAIVITCGIRRVWEKVLANHRLTNTKVIGGGRVSDGYIISPSDKRDLVAHLQARHKLTVCAFGDSPLDLPMLKQADHAVVVVGDETTRSASMEAKLEYEINSNGLLACQALLPGSVSARLDSGMLPIVELDNNFYSSFLERNFQSHLPASTGAVKLLATPMRDASNAGPILRENHRRTGWYLAMHSISDLVGVETFLIKNVQGREDIGSRLLHERQTLIVPLMRGGEPMALGVSDAFPLAMFVHAKLRSDMNAKLLEDCKTVILVDSVINSGKSVIEFVRYIRSRLRCRSRIIVVAGVVQEEAAGAGGELARALAGYGKVDLVALRQSRNKFKGVGGTDTGHRLFNTTHLD